MRPAPALDYRSTPSSIRLAVNSSALRRIDDAALSLRRAGFLRGGGASFALLVGVRFVVRYFRCHFLLLLFVCVHIALIKPRIAHAMTL